MKKIIFTILMLFCLSLYAQEEAPKKEDTLALKEKTDPIFFAESFFGLGNVDSPNDNISSTFSFGGELNYQFNKNLFSARFLYHSSVEVVPVLIAIPVFIEREKHVEWGALYGRRWIFNGSSVSISGGISLNHSTFFISNQDSDPTKLRENHVGVPLEVNFKFFKSKKDRYRIYGMIPVGKPTSFGRSVGFKLIGNISKYSFIGVGLTFGFGFHKKY